MIWEQKFAMLKKLDLLLLFSQLRIGRSQLELPRLYIALLVE